MKLPQEFAPYGRIPPTIARYSKLPAPKSPAKLHCSEFKLTKYLVFTKKCKQLSKSNSLLKHELIDLYLRILLIFNNLNAF